MALTRRIIEGRAFGSIIKLPVKAQVIVEVTEIRDNVGPLHSSLVGAKLADGTDIALTGHTDLIDKIIRSEAVLPSWFLIEKGDEIPLKSRPGQTLHVYGVEALANSRDEILADKDGAALVKATAKLVTDIVDAEPPRA